MHLNVFGSCPVATDATWPIERTLRGWCDASTDLLCICSCRDKCSLRVLNQIARFRLGWVLFVQTVIFYCPWFLKRLTVCIYASVCCLTLHHIIQIGESFVLYLSAQIDPISCVYLLFSPWKRFTKQSFKPTRVDVMRGCSEMHSIYCCSDETVLLHSTAFTLDHNSSSHNECTWLELIKGVMLLAARGMCFFLICVAEMMLVLFDAVVFRNEVNGSDCTCRHWVLLIRFEFQRRIAFMSFLLHIDWLTSKVWSWDEEFVCITFLQWSD